MKEDYGDKGEQRTLFVFDEFIKKYMLLKKRTNALAGSVHATHFVSAQTMSIILREEVAVRPTLIRFGLEEEFLVLSTL
jgi:hypothetical protein